jgi:hypothetical protein
LPQEGYIVVRDRASAIGEQRVHARHDTQCAHGTQVESHDSWPEN